jgi:small subunit ribosomal protein S5
MEEKEINSVEVTEEVAVQPEKRDFKRNPKNFKRQARPIVSEYTDRVVKINRVSKTVKGGRKLRFSALVVIGNGKGKVGFGLGKAKEVPEAIKKAKERAQKNLITVSFAEGFTFHHIVEGKFGATKVFLKPAPDGSGIIAGGPVRAVLELAGVKNIFSKVYGSRSAVNVVRATINGIINTKTPESVKKLRSTVVE